MLHYTILNGCWGCLSIITLMAYRAKVNYLRCYVFMELILTTDGIWRSVGVVVVMMLLSLCWGHKDK